MFELWKAVSGCKNEFMKEVLMLIINSKENCCIKGLIYLAKICQKMCLSSVHFPGL